MFQSEKQLDNHQSSVLHVDNNGFEAGEEKNKVL